MFPHLPPRNIELIRPTFPHRPPIPGSSTAIPSFGPSISDEEEDGGNGEKPGHRAANANTDFEVGVCGGAWICGWEEGGRRRGGVW